MEEEIYDSIINLRVEKLLMTVRAVLRQNSMRTENSAIPCRDGCPIQVIPSPSSAKNLSPEEPRPVYLYI